TAEHLDDRLVAEADAECPGRRREPLEDRFRRARVPWETGTGGDDELIGPEPFGFVRVDRVVPANDDVRTELTEKVRQVLRERVVVIDEEDHRRSFSASSIAVSTPARLRRHSSFSAAWA